MKKKFLKVKRVEDDDVETMDTKPRKNTRIDPEISGSVDRIKISISKSPVDDFWISFGYESDVKSDETVDSAKERILGVVVESIEENCEQIIKAYGGEGNG